MGHQLTELASYGEIVVVVVVIVVVVAVGKPSTDENGDSFLSGKASTHALRIAVGKAYAVGKASTELGKPLPHPMGNTAAIHFAGLCAQSSHHGMQHSRLFLGRLAWVPSCTGSTAS